MTASQDHDPLGHRWVRWILIGLGTLAALTLTLVVLGPVSAWWVEHIDKVPLDGKGAVTGKDRQEVLDKARGRLAGVTAGLLAAAAIYYTAKNAASARRTAEASIHAAEASYKAAEASERTTQAAFHSAEAAQETARAAVRTAAATERGLVTGRYTSAVDQLGSDKPAVQLGGVHALAGIADDALDMRQTCIDVLCAYLRLPYDPDPGDHPDRIDDRKAYRAFREVRHTVIRLIGNHLCLDVSDPHSWQGHDFDFTDVIFDGGDLSNACFSNGTVTFARAVFTNDFSFDGANFSGGRVDFKSATVSRGRLGFKAAEFAGGTVSFHGVVLSDGLLDFSSASFSGSRVSFQHAEFSGGKIGLGYAKFTGGWVSFTGTSFSGSRVSFQQAEFSGSRIDFDYAKFSSRWIDLKYVSFLSGQVTFMQARLSSGGLDFAGARFSGSQVDFTYAEFLGGEVHFHEVRRWEVPPVGILGEHGCPVEGILLPGENE